MSTSVDSRIVEMRFDNSQFEKASKQSLGTLEKLQDALNFKKSDGLGGLSSAAAGIDLSGVAKSVDNISDRFSSLGIVGMTVLQKLTDAAWNFTAKTTNVLLKPIQMIKSGGMQRAMNMQQAEFQFKGLGMNSEKTLAAINKSLQGTPYSLDQAAKVMASIGAGGITDAKSIQHITSSIAGTAAMTNSSFAEIGDIYSTIASNGKLMTQQMRQLSFRGLNVSAVLAKSLGKTPKEVEDMVSKGQISFKQFSNAMEKAFGAHATKSTEMYTGALEDLKAALSRIGAKPATQKLNSLRDIFNSLVPVVDRINEALDPFIKKFNAGMKFASDTVSTFFKTIGKGGDGFDALNKSFDFIFRKTSKMKGLKPVLQNIKDSFTGIFSVFSLFGDIFKNAVKNSSPFVNIVKSLGEAFFSLTGAIGRFLTNFSKTLRQSGLIKATFEGLKKVVSKVSDIFSHFTDFVTKLGEAFGRGKEKGISGALKDAAESGKSASGIFSALGKVFNAVYGTMSEALQAFGKAVSKTDISSFFAAFATLSISSMAKSFGTFFNTLTKSVEDFKPLETIKGLSGKISKVFDELRASLVAFQNQLNANTIVKLATAIGILTLSMSVLSDMDTESLTKSVMAIGAMMSMLVVAVNKMKGMGNASAVTEKKGPLAFITNFIGGAAIDQAAMAATVTGLIGIATAVGILSLAVTKLGKIKVEDLVKGLIGTAVALKLLLMAVDSLSDMKKKGLIKSGTSLILLSTGLNILATAVKKFGNLSVSELAKGLTAVAVGLGAFVGVLKLLDEYKGSSIKIGVAFTVLSTGMVILSSAISRLGALDISALAKGIGAVGVSLGILGIYVKAMGNAKSVISAGISIGIIASGLVILTTAINKLGKTDIKTLATGIGAVAASLLVLCVAVKSMSGANAIAVGAGIVIMAAGLEILTDVISKLGNLSFAELGKALLVFAVSMAALAAASALLAPIVPAMVAVAGALSLFGAAVFLAGAGMALLGTGITSLAIAFTTYGAAILGSLLMLADSIPVLFEKIGEGVVVVFATIGEGLPVIVDAVVGLLIGIAEAIANNAYRLGAATATAILEIMRVITDYLPLLAEQGALMLISLINGMSQAIAEHGEELIDAIINLLTTVVKTACNFLFGGGEAGGNSFLAGFNSDAMVANTKKAKKNLEQNGKPNPDYSSAGKKGRNTYNLALGGSTGETKKMKEALEKAGKPNPDYSSAGKKGKDSFNSAFGGSTAGTKKAAKALEKAAKPDVNLKSTGKNGGQGLADGLREKKPEVAAAASELAGTVKKHASIKLEVHSPSRVMYRIGDYATQGFILGIKEKFDKVGKVSEELGSTLISGTNGLTAMLVDSLASIEDYQPTIKPVVDMSNVNASAGLIGNLFSNNVSMNGTMKSVRAVGSINTKNAVAAQNSMIETVAEKVAQKMSDSFAEKLGDTNHTYTFNIPFDINGREVAKSIATYTQDELNKMESRTNRKLGLI